MALPETIPIKYTEEEAEFVSIRPVVRQVFRAEELVDMVLGVTGKDVARIQQILRSGTVVFHFYRYWWQGFEAAAEDLAALLARFPDADPSRTFDSRNCSAVILENDTARGAALELGKQGASRKRLFKGRSMWDSLMALAEAQPPQYQGYSYARRADTYALHLSEVQRETLMIAAARLGPKALKTQSHVVQAAKTIVFVCPRGGAQGAR